MKYVIVVDDKIMEIEMFELRHPLIYTNIFFVIYIPTTCKEGRKDR
jgi:hypothetical protein